jgi:FkbM family methyltransferase
MIIDLKYLIEKYKLNLNGVLHIGAHAGGEYELYKELNLKSIILIEPQPNIFERLKSNVKDDSAILINCAIGNFNGKTEMWTSENDENGTSSILEPNIYKEQYSYLPLNKKIEVDVKKVDDLDIPKVNFINIDVQGYELEALKGAEQYLENVDYIMSEVNTAEIYSNSALIGDLDEFLSKFGFKRVETNMCGGNWGDAFYLKQIN